MVVVLYLLTFLSVVAGVTVSLEARSAMHEILAGVCFLTAAVTLVGAVVGGQIDQLRLAIEKQTKAQTGTP